MNDLEAAKEMRERTVEYLRDMAQLYVRYHSGSIYLGVLNLYMKTLSRDDGLISEAVSSLLTRKILELDHERVVHCGGAA